MAITASELIIRKAANNSDTVPASNGGEMSTTVVSSGAQNNVFPNTTQAERTAGITRFRKVYMKNNSSENLALQSTKIFLDDVTPAADSMAFHAGTNTDVESDLVGTELLFGCGDLAVNATALDTSLQITIEDDQVASPLDIFRDGVLIRVTDKATANAVTGNEEYVSISTIGTFTGSVLTVNLATPLQNSYVTATTRVMSVYEPGNVEPTLGSFVVTSASGTFDDAQMSADTRGAIYETWSLVFTSATAFDLHDSEGATGFSGNTSAQFAPTNPNTSTPYFTIPTAAFGGTFATSDTVAFTATPAAVPLWLKQQVPAGTASYSANTVPLVIDGESA